jgi:glycosyltransferase involved in cell wall biosynthesis
VKFYGLYVLWEDPLIISTFAGPAQESVVHNIKSELDVIYHPYWIWTYRTIPWFFQQEIRSRYTNKRAHYLCSSSSELRLLRRLGLGGALSSLSTYIGEHVFSIRDGERKYDAVYAAQMERFKRIELASEIEKLFVLTYGPQRDEAGHFDLHSYCPEVSHCDFNSTLIDRELVAQKYNEARVGLALSQKEGAMIAFVEYLLCGLPVVSTPAQGGREEFFDDAYVKIVPPEAKAIARAVQEWIDADTDPQKIRGLALAKLKKQRIDLCKFVDNLVVRRGAKAPGFEAIYERLYDSEEGAVSHFVRGNKLLAAGFQLKDNSSQA